MITHPPTKQMTHFIAQNIVENAYWALPVIAVTGIIIVGFIMRMKHQKEHTS